MASNQQLRRRIKTSGNISKITKAMESVAASKMKKAQDVAISGKTYESLMRNMAEHIMQFSDASTHPLLAGSKDQELLPTLLIIVSADRGLCGPLNSNVFRLAEQQIQDSSLVVAVGKKALLYAQKSSWNLVANIGQIADKPEFSTTLTASSVALTEFLAHRVGKVQIIYPKFINTLSQQIVCEQLLPFTGVQLTSSENILRPKYIFEPESNELLDELLPAYVRLGVYQAILSMKASEQSARMIAMKNASENASDVKRLLQLMYNQNRQKAITSEISDIVTATMAMN